MRKSYIYKQCISDMNIELGFRGSQFGYELLPSQQPSHNIVRSKDWNVGIIFIIGSAICSAFGNSLEPVTALAWFITPCLLVGLYLTILKYPAGETSSASMLQIMSLVVVSQGIGFMVGFLTMFSYPEVTLYSIVLTVLVGCLLWLIITVISLVALVKFSQQYESVSWALFIFPITYTTVMHTFIGRIFSTFPSISNSMLDYAPLREIAAVIGSPGITFAVTTVGAAMAVRNHFILLPNALLLYLLLLTYFA